MTSASLPPSKQRSPKQLGIIIRPLREEDLRVADRIFRVAFGTYLELPDPMIFMGDAEFVRTRWLADPSAALGAELDGELVGVNFATRWGSVGFFGPLAIRPDMWNRGIAQLLLEPTMDLFARWGIRHAGLFTFANSTKHSSLYQKFGFWPRFLTALMDLQLGSESASTRWTRFSTLSVDDKQRCLQAGREVTNSAYEGLDVEREIRAVDEQHLGDTVLIWNGSQLAGFAVCHVGAGTEAGNGKCYIKFGAVRCGPDASRKFRQLLDACREFAASASAQTLTAGVNLSHLDAYREMLRAGFQTTRQGLVMERDGNPGYNRPDVFLIDDWR